MYQAGGQPGTVRMPGDTTAFTNIGGSFSTALQKHTGPVSIATRSPPALSSALPASLIFLQGSNTGLAALPSPHAALAFLHPPRLQPGTAHPAPRLCGCQRLDPGPAVLCLSLFSPGLMPCAEMPGTSLPRWDLRGRFPWCLPPVFGPRSRRTLFPKQL